MRSRTAGILVLVIAAALLALPAMANSPRTYDITITNVTRGQIFSPPVVVVHSPDISLWTLGEPASDALAAAAEDADYAPLVEILEGSELVDGYAVADGPLMPGASVTVTVTADPGPRGVISALGMLVTTNDAFFGFSQPELPVLVIRGGPKFVVGGDAVAYDAGSEANNELCEYIPGPPCGNPFVRATEDAEGFVHVHAGIHGIGDLAPAVWDWRNPVAVVTVHRH
jgi:hypothetical protein